MLFNIEVVETNRGIVTVEAADEKEARENAVDLYLRGDAFWEGTEWEFRSVKEVGGQS